MQINDYLYCLYDMYKPIKKSGSVRLNFLISNTVVIHIV